MGAQGLFHVRYFVGPNGRTASSTSREEWLRARRTGVTATDARKIVKLNGATSAQRLKLIEQKLSGEEGPMLAAYQHGIEREPVIAEWVRRNFNITPNAYLCVGDNPRHLATPDGIGDGVVCEIKTSIYPLAKAIGTYRDQLQWQLHVTDSKRLLLVVENTHSQAIEHQWVYKDLHRIATLTLHAGYFLEDLDGRLAEIGRPPEPTVTPHGLPTTKPRAVKVVAAATPVVASTDRTRSTWVSTLAGAPTTKEPCLDSKCGRFGERCVNHQPGVRFFDPPICRFGIK